MAAIDLSTLSVADLIKELEDGVSALTSALEVVEKFDVFLPKNIQTIVSEAVTVLSAVQSVITKI